MPTMTIFDEMVAAYNPQNAEQRLNAQHQTMQHGGQTIAPILLPMYLKARTING